MQFAPKYSWEMPHSSPVKMSYGCLLWPQSLKYIQILMIYGGGICCEIALIWMLLDFTDDQSILVQEMAWCRQATSHYLSQCWPRSLSTYGVTRPQWLDCTVNRIWTLDGLRAWRILLAWGLENSVWPKALTIFLPKPWRIMLVCNIIWFGWSCCFRILWHLRPLRPGVGITNKV